MEPKPNLEEQEGYYTGRWNTFSYANNLDLQRVAAILDVLARIGFEAPPAICDLGCGAGWATGIFGMFGKTTGVDLSDTARASERYPHCTFVSANILEWDAPQATFDVAMSVEVIEHIERPLQAKYLGIAHRLLKPGGHLILTTPNGDTMRAMPQGGKEWSHQPIEDWLNPSELRHLLEQGFTVESVDSIISGMGRKGSYRLMNSAKVDGLMQSVGVGNAWERLRLRSMYGLHLVAHAQKPIAREGP
jgi:2-polyprenyl-3-methyl-5-hydroxy-6-metoxy-1,4-benzoquinol methylase